MSQDAPTLGSSTSIPGPSTSGTLPLGDTVTVRGWDGWPTPPTPGYLVPKMGELPISSTVQFKTVAITSIGDGVSTELWGKLRAPLQQALGEKEKRVAQGFVVTRAVYGKLTVTETNVTEKVAALVRNNTLSISPSNATFGNADPGTVNSLQVQYTIGGASGSATASGNETIDLAGALAIASAILTETRIDSSMDVTQKVAALGS